MAIRVNPLLLPVHHDTAAIRKKLLSLLRISERELLSFSILRRSVDARKKEEILYAYSIDAFTKCDARILKKNRDRRISAADTVSYRPPEHGTEQLTERPVIIGAGPAGLFAGLLLAEQGYRPLLLERGLPAEERRLSVEHFWKNGALNTESNVSFGEGGAGTFSDGKLNTLVKDAAGRNRSVLETFVRFGADEEILYDHKPHIGTDRLIGIVGAMRREIERLGGEVRFQTRAEHLQIENGQLTGFTAVRTDVKYGEQSSAETIPCEVLIAATGHSARDTFQNFLEDGVAMEAKAFAVGVRVQHPQHMIDVSQYGEKEAEFLSPAPYKLTAKTAEGRGVYSFCMCPGGYVVNASTEPGMTAVNGMSYHDRASGTANAAVIVTVTPDDFGAEGPLAGVEFQRELERRAFQAGRGRIPVQLYGDFCAGRSSVSFGAVRPCFCGETQFADLNPVLGPVLSTALREGMQQFDRKIHGFAREDAILAGVESRTSSPVRIPRDTSFQSAIRGLYPCGEGAGYAGGITSAAMDGLKVAEAIIRRYAPMEEKRENKDSSDAFS